jgi:hypothetical protein
MAPPTDSGSFARPRASALRSSAYAITNSGNPPCQKTYSQAVVCS